MCVTSLQSLTQISLQVPLSPSSPKFYWDRENEGHKLRAHINTAPFPAPHSPHFPWPRPRRPGSWPPPLAMGSGREPGTLLSFPTPSLLS